MLIIVSITVSAILLRIQINSHFKDIFGYWLPVMLALTEYRLKLKQMLDIKVEKEFKNFKGN